MRPQVVLITGSTGYIGRNLLQYLHQEAGVECLCADRTHGYDLSVTGWTDRLPDREIDLVFHLAQSRRYREFPDGAKDMFAVNLSSTAELLEWSRTHGVKTFFLASSGSVYAPASGRLAETAPCSPVSMYAATKYAAEVVAQPYQRFFQVIVGRLFGVYGPGHQRMLIAETAAKIKLDQPITLAGGVGIYLTPLYVGDCTKTVLALTDGSVKERFLVVNIAADENLSLKEIVCEMGRQLGRTPRTVVTDEAPRSLCADISRLRLYYPGRFVPFADGLRNMLAPS